MITDWRYSKERLNLRNEVLLKLLRRFGAHNNKDGSPMFSQRSIYECAHDWVSGGKFSTEGVIDFYLENYT